MQNSMESSEQIYFVRAINIMNSCLWLSRRIPYSLIRYNSTNIPPIDTLFQSCCCSDACRAPHNVHIVAHNVHTNIAHIPLRYCVSFIIVLSDQASRSKARVGSMHCVYIFTWFLALFHLEHRHILTYFPFFRLRRIKPHRCPSWCACKMLQ